MSLGVSSRKRAGSPRTGTKSKIKDFTITIDTSSLSIETGQKIVSSTFDSGISDEIKCYLEIYPYGYSEQLNDFSSIFLCFEGFVKLPMPIEVEFYILNKNGVKENIKMIKETDIFSTINRLGIYNFIETNEYYRTLYNKYDCTIQETITVGCEISFNYDSLTIDTHSTTNKVKKRFQPLVNDIKRKFELSQLSDCTIVAGNLKIKAHKCILASRSSTFLSIFIDKETRVQSNTIEINDFRPEVVEEMITYIYTKTSPNLNIMASELLIIATKYNLKKLKKMAEESLCNSLNVTNSCDYLELSESYRAKLLKDCCIYFICENALDVIESKNWKTIVTKYPLLLEEILISVIKAN